MAVLRLDQQSRSPEWLILQGSKDIILPFFYTFNRLVNLTPTNCFSVNQPFFSFFLPQISQVFRSTKITHAGCRTGSGGKNKGVGENDAREGRWSNPLPYQRERRCARIFSGLFIPINSREGTEGDAITMLHWVLRFFSWFFFSLLVVWFYFFKDSAYVCSLLIKKEDDYIWILFRVSIQIINCYRSK